MGESQEAEAANLPWHKLLRYHEPCAGLTDSEQQAVLRAAMKSAIHTFTTLLVQIQAMDSDPADDSYAWETMSESPVRRAPYRRNRCTDHSFYRNLPQFAVLHWMTLMRLSMTV